TGSIQLSIEALDALTREYPRVAQLQSQIDGDDVIEGRAEVAGRGQHPDRGCLPDFTLDAESANDRAAAGSGIRWSLVTRRAVVRNQTAKCPPSCLAGETAGKFGIGDVTREE